MRGFLVLGWVVPLVVVVPYANFKQGRLPMDKISQHFIDHELVFGLFLKYGGPLSKQLVFLKKKNNQLTHMAFKWIILNSAHFIICSIPYL